MSPLLHATTLVLILVGDALGQPLHNRDVDCRNTKTSTTVKLICQSLWYLEGTIAHCPNGTACNQTALTGIKSSIQSNLCLWVRLLEIILNDRHSCNLWSVQVAQQCPTLIPSTSNCSNMALEDTCGSIYVQLLWNVMFRVFIFHLFKLRIMFNKLDNVHLAHPNSWWSYNYKGAYIFSSPHLTVGVLYLKRTVNHLMLHVPTKMKVGEQTWRDVQQLTGNISMRYFAPRFAKIREY